MKPVNCSCDIISSSIFISRFNVSSLHMWSNRGCCSVYRFWSPLGNQQDQLVFWCWSMLCFPAGFPPTQHKNTTRKAENLHVWEASSSRCNIKTVCGRFSVDRLTDEADEMCRTRVISTDLHHSGHLHQRDEFSLHTVAQPPRQLRQQSFEGPELLQLLITHSSNNQWSTAAHLRAASAASGDIRWYLSEVQHAGAEGRGRAEQSLDEASAQLELVGHDPQVGLLQ